MTTRASDNVLVQLVLTGMDSFYADDSWRDKISGLETCPHCRNIYEKVRSIDVIVRNKRRKTDLDLIGPFCGRVCIFSTHFIDVVGAAQVERVAGLGSVIDVQGFEHDRHRTALARHESVVVRGSERSDPGLCKKCGRLLYAAGGDKYILRSQIPDEPFFLSDGEVFCTNQFWKDYIYGANLTRVEALEYPIQEKPDDGLPASIPAMKAYLKARRKFR